MSKQKTLLGLAALCLAFLTFQYEGLAAFSWISKAHAAWDPGGESLTSSISYIVGILITGLNIGMWVLFQLLDIVLDPFFIFDLKAGGADGPLLQMLHSIWELTRDLMNVVFAILLIIGAVMTIIRSNTELIKSYRGKFVIAIILINFSWFIPRVILDVSQVLTYTVYQIPSLLNNGGPPTCTLPGSADGTIKPRDCEIVTEVKFLEEAEKMIPSQDQTQLPRITCALQGLVCYKAESFRSQKAWNHNVIINGLIINHARLGVLANITNPRQGGAQPAPGASEIRATLTFLMRLLIVLMIHVGLFFPMLAMVVGFFIRIPILWITMAFMPVAFMGFVIGDKIPNFNPVEKIWKRFITAALLPAMVAVPLTVGFVMINAGVNVPAPTGIAKFQTVLPIFTGVKDIWQLLWMFIALVIMWIGTFAVLKQDELIGKFTEPIKQYGEGIGKFAMKAPLAIPFLPGPAGGPKVAPLEFIKGASSSNLNAMLADGRLDKEDQKRFMGGKAAQQTTAKAQAALKNSPIKIDVKTIINNPDFIDNDNAKRNAKVSELVTKLKTLTEFQNLSTEDILKNVLQDANATGLTPAEVQRIRDAVAKGFNP